MADSDRIVIEAELQLNYERAQASVKTLERQLRNLVEQRQNIIAMGGNVKSIDNAIRMTSASLSAARERVEGFAASMRSAGLDAKTSFGEVDGALSKLGRTMAGVFSAKMAVDFAKRVAQTRGEFQQLEIAFGTILGSKDKADKMMAGAVELAAKTPFDLQGVAAGAKSLLAYGMESDKVIESLRRLGDVAAGLSLPLGRLTAIYGQTMVKGKLQTRDLLRYQAAGIPILDELAKMYGKNTNQVREMVTAGKVGFADVEKVFVRMTDEGGKFANLMEKQSASITGHISNIQDAIDEMFNEIGKKSEGVIYKGLGLVASLVDNYEKVGRVLADIVVTYGAYKAAVMVVTALEARHTAMVLANAAGVEASYLRQIKLLKTISALKLNNPEVLAATAVAAVSVGLLRMAKDADTGAEGIRRAAAEVERLNEKYTKYNDEINRNVSIAEDVNAADSDRMEAIHNLVEMFPSLLEKYGSEYEILKKIRDVKVELSGETLQMEYDEYANDVAGLRRELAKLNEDIETAGRNGAGQAIPAMRARAEAIEQEIDALDKKLQDPKFDVLYDGPAKPTGEGAKKRTVADVQKEIRETNKNIAELRKKSNAGGLTDKERQSLDDELSTLKTLQAEYKKYTGSKSGGTGADYMSTAAEKALKLERERRKQVLDTEQERINLMQDGYDRELAQNRLNHARALESIQTEKEDRLKAIQEEEFAQAKAKNGKLKKSSFKPVTTELEGDDLAYFTQKVKNANDRLVTDNKASYDKMVLEYGGALDRMTVMGEGYDAKIAQARKNATKAETEEERARLTDYADYLEKRKELELAKAGETAAENGTAEERRAALERRLDAELALVEDKQKEMKAALNGLALAEFDLKEVETYGDVLGDVVPALLSKMEAQLKTLPAQMRGRAEDATDETLAALARTFAESAKDADFTEWYANLGDKTLKALRKELERAQSFIESVGVDEEDGEGAEKALAAARLQVAALKEQIRQLTTENAKSNISWKEAADIISAAAGAFDELGAVIGGPIGEAISTLGRFSTSVVGVLNGLDAFKKAADGSVEKAVAGLSIFTAAISVFSKIMDIVKGNEAAMERASAAAREYAQSLKQIADAQAIASLSNAFGTDSYGAFVKQMDIMKDARKSSDDLVKRFTEFNNLIFNRGTKLSFSTGNGWQKFWGTDDKESKDLMDFFDEDGVLKLDELKAWYDEYGEYLSSAQTNLVDGLISEWERYEAALESMNEYLADIFGNTAESIADKMLESFGKTGDAMADLSDIASDFGKNLAKSMVTSILMTDVFTEEAQNAIRDMLLSGNTAGAVDAYNKLLEDANAKAPEITEFLRSLNVDWNPDERTGESKGIAQASQDSVNELNGRAAVIQEHTYQINESVAAIRAQNEALIANSADILSEVRGIHEDTTVLRDKMDSVLEQGERIYNDIDWMMDKGLKAN